MITKYLHNMKQKIPTLMLGIASMLASCSQNDEVLQSDNNTGKLQTVTITATLEDGMTTRATPNTSETDATVTRCFMEVVENGTTIERQSVEGSGSFSFSTYLEPRGNYTFYFWADGGSSYYTVNGGLDNITLPDGTAPSIAYRGETSWKNGNSTNMDVMLTHAVAKVSLRTTTTIYQAQTVSMTVPSYTVYNARTGSTTGENPTDFDYTFSGDVPGTSEESGFVCSAYSLVPTGGTTWDIDLRYASQPERTQTSVPVAPNQNTSLVGDLYHLGLQNLTFTVDTESKWTDTTHNFQ